MKFREYDKLKYHYLRVIWEAHKSWNYEQFYDFLDDDCKLSIQWIKDDVQWKENVINYYDTKEKPEYAFYEIVQLEWIMKEGGVRVDKLCVWNEVKENAIVKIMYEEWDLCILLNQYFAWDSKIYDVLIHIKLNDKKLVTNITITETQFYDIREFILPLYFWDEELGDDWHPLYEEDNILNDQELCNAACMVSQDAFKDWWYEVTFIQPMLSQSPNIVAEKDWKEAFFTVRWFHSKDLAKPWFNKDWLLPREVYEKNLPDRRLIKYDVNLAKKEKADYNILLCYFTSQDPKHKKEWLVYRWDVFVPDISCLEQWDFEC